MTIAIVPSAGSGRRFGSKRNKVFYPLLGIPILARTLQRLQACQQIDEIIPVIQDCDTEDTRELIERFALTKVKRLAPGGERRQDSVCNALGLICGATTGTAKLVLIHDAARPLISDALLRDCIAGLSGCDGIVCAVAVKDTVKEVADGYVVKTLRRDSLMAVQTPQVFLCSTILEAYSRAAADGLTFTDDTSAVEHYGGRIKIIDGEYANIKITTRDDLAYAQWILSQQTTSG
ncbi:MAG: 2-C-methyl-D-erythritol 4-phosphate cytidylyltransferase [Nitrospirae bacterium]|uniref:2-C-methyl-D-erythritol 4-phosphate cytidylyltransferase n=1 Tax=Candidatus Magnetobacterium casense TaxID=1455061 RepID=UPI00058D6D00|nr:2-C-methyl-D-erythritol 4-phosphate cytidylyltransferase [Candidatus Magnetobacterium casensis]MBF0336901.1 2-C-methyl-D-erythritol 4-phosphate cytidylyltransferase [Nitrospirota bacterium]